MLTYLTLERLEETPTLFWGFLDLDKENGLHSFWRIDGWAKELG
jgi:hypothetical protein